MEQAPCGWSAASLPPMDAPLPPIQSILFCKFDVTLGPTLVFQTPAEPDMQGVFADIKKYLIAKPELSEHLMSMHLGHAQVVGFPIHILGNQYERNHLLFNVAFVFRPEDEPAAYEPIVRKLGRYFYTLERESGLVSNPARRPVLQTILDRVHRDLNAQRQCLLSVGRCGPPAVLSCRVRLVLFMPPRRRLSRQTTTTRSCSKSSTRPKWCRPSRRTTCPSCSATAKSCRPLTSTPLSCCCSRSSTACAAPST